MMRMIGDSHWNDAMREMQERPELKHVFVKGDRTDRYAPLTKERLEQSTWEYVVMRPQKNQLSCVTYHCGKQASCTTFTYATK